MSDAELNRELTALEFVVLGFIGQSPQSGYSIISYLEDGSVRFSASPGSVYPMLKRLEGQGVIEGELDSAHESRPRKIYTLTPRGERLLDRWLRTAPPANVIIAERTIFLQRFLFAENRLSADEVVSWLDACDQQLADYQQLRGVWDQTAMAQMTLHQHLLYEATIMDINAIRTWIQMARARVAASRR